ncbi:hypothetical protein GCM10007874_04080 [Labrys miyagiensis]|uniref:Uncharacterized protein n=1 Tax=Labrys miyagiensis TaxID=346912 RepID=A0ABQ6CCK0_9HYPH|nr:hypothetical protein GCM10007874_04080 [Labrys miyagiensis]
MGEEDMRFPFAAFQQGAGPACNRIIPWERRLPACICEAARLQGRRRLTGLPGTAGVSPAP